MINFCKIKKKNQNQKNKIKKKNQNPKHFYMCMDAHIKYYRNPSPFNIIVELKSM